MIFMLILNVSTKWLDSDLLSELVDKNTLNFNEK